MKQLVICEKPSVARDVAAALSGTHTFSKTPWGFTSAGMHVAAAAGHLVAELPPDRYDKKYENWNYDDLPILPERFMYQPRDRNAGARLRQLAELINDADVGELINACDAGREGELIFKLIVQFARPKTPKTILRAWFSSMTPTAIQAAFSALKPDRELIPLEYAARCRSEADWYVGMNATRSATCTLGGGRQTLSMGRVQTPTLALVVRRDVEIETFVPEDFHCVRATFELPSGSYGAWWRTDRDATSNGRFSVRADAEELAARVAKSRRAWVESVEVSEEQVRPPKLFDLNELQREANRRYGLTATATLEAAQACYEEHKVLSYPRTDSCWLTTDMIAEVPKFLARVRAADPSYAPLVDAVAAAAIDPSKLANDAKVNDHHAIVPTDSAHDLSKLNQNQRRIYDLVARRLVAALLPPQRLERTVVWSGAETDTQTEWFHTSGRRVLDDGWKVALPPAETTKQAEADSDSDDEPDEEVPEIVVGAELRVAEVTVTDQQTKPPARFTEASLLGAMSSAGRLVTDDEMAEAMKDSGLGTPATRAATIERLMKVEYLERQGRQIRATAKGRGLILALDGHPLTVPDLTGEWERRLRNLERANPADATGLRESFIADVRRFTSEIVGGFAGRTPEQLAVGRRKIAECPVPGCDGTVVEGRRAWGCDTYKSREEPGCGFIVWMEAAGKKVTEKQLLAKIDQVRSGAVTVEKPAERVVLGKCPSAGCEGEIVERPKSWGCTSWKGTKSPGCGYTLWKKNPDGTELTAERAAELLAAGETNGRPEPEKIADCPRCGTKSQIVDRGKFYGCNSWKSPRSTGCNTMVWKVQDGHEITADELAEQLAALVGTKAEKRRSSRKPSRATARR